MKIISLFSGAGGLDLGFKKAGFNTVWANEFDSKIWNTFESNFPNVPLDRRSIVDIPNEDIPDAEGIIGGPPCQSWSEAGSRRGIDDKRGQLFFEYVRVLEAKKPLFFLAENVSGILSKRHKEAFEKILSSLGDVGYEVSYKLLNANDYEVPQERLRVIIVGYHREKIGRKFEFPEPKKYKPNLQDAISDLKDAVPAKPMNKTNGELKTPNNEYMTGGFSMIYMSRNRVRSWDEPSFTIQAGGRHAPIHPQAPKMKHVEKDKKEFVPGMEEMYRRLSVRECARIQTFPDDFKFKYNYLADAYKMIGNAVPVEFAKNIANKIMKDITNFGCS